MSSEGRAKVPFLGLSVGRSRVLLAEDFIADPWEVEEDRKLAFDKWNQSKDRYFPNEVSNFLPYPKHSPLVYEGLSYRFPEAFYQALKSKDPEYRKAVSECEAANKTKWLAGKLAARGEVRKDWFGINIDIMTHAQKHRIEADPEFHNWLKSTRHHYLYEWCNWGDDYWAISIYTGQGQNRLGRVLMILRDLVYFKT